MRESYLRHREAPNVCARVLSDLKTKGLDRTTTGRPLRVKHVSGMAAALGIRRPATSKPRRCGAPKRFGGSCLAWVMGNGHCKVHGGEHRRPKYRAECADVPRPCPWFSCRHHLGPEQLWSAQRPHGLLYDPDLVAAIDSGDLSGLDRTCTFDVVEEQVAVIPEAALHVGITDNQEIGRIMGYTRARILQILQGALDKVERTDPDVAERLRGWYEATKRLTDD